MNCKFKIFISLLCMMLLASNVFAEFTNTAQNSFIDNSTGLEWIDFGITNNKSFNDVQAELSTTYSGWRLPTYDEVKTLWSGMFDQPSNSSC